MKAAFPVAVMLVLLASPAWADDPVALVDPIVGTSGNVIDGPSDTFPGADVPFGMVQWSPDTPSQPPGGGYLYNDGQITGFSLTHLSGPGCPVFGDISILPTVGPVTNPAQARQPFTHATEEASPGYYGILLGQPAIQTRLTVTPRSGLASFTFPTSPQSNVVINAASNQAGVAAASVRFVGTQEVVGSATAGWFCGMPGSYTVYFALRFNRPFLAQGTWLGDALGSVQEASGVRTGAWASFDTTQDQTVKAQAAISFVSIDGALANLRAEAKSWDIDAVRATAAAAWRAELGRVRTQGGTPQQRRVFYTALYHALLHPNVVSDVDGQYAGFDGHVHRAAPGHQEYATFSGWDVYRTQIALVAMLDPRRAGDMMESLVHAAQQSGWLPKWSLVNAESAVMGGDPADPIIASAYAFGARDFDVRSALASMVKGAIQASGPGGQGWYVQRPGLQEYKERGYVVNDHTTNVAPVPNGASLTLEYALDDFSISRLADALGDGTIARAMLLRSQSWANVFDSATGLVAPRDRDGAFMGGPVTANGQSGFQEGNAAQYTWMVPQDLNDLVRGMGGAAAANARLDTFFSVLDAGQDKPYAWLGNEPSIGSPWVYLSTGAPWKAQRVIRDAMTQLWGDTPDGVPGNDDLGTMSAWYVWCAIGLYPQNPASGVLDIGAPLFTHVDIKAPGMAGIAVDAPAASTANAFIQSLTVNGEPWPHSWIAYSIAKPVRLDFALGSMPNTGWAAAPQDEPPSYRAAPISFPPATQARLVTESSELSLSAGGSATFPFTVKNPDGAQATSVSWHAVVPEGLQMAPAAARSAVIAGQSVAIAAELQAQSGLHPGLYDVSIAGVSDNGALLQRATRVVRVGQHLAFAYATNFFDDSIQAIDPATAAFGAPIAVGQNPRDLAVDAQRGRAYVAAEGVNQVSVVDLGSGSVIASVRVGSTPWGIRLTPDGRTVWVANNGDNTVQPVDTQTLSAGAPIPVGLAPGDLVISPDGTMLYVADQNSNDVTPIDLRTRMALAPIAVGARPRGLAITPDGTTVFASSMGSNSVTPIDVASGKAAAPIPVGVAPRGLAVSPNGRWLFVANFGTNDVTPIDVATRKAGLPILVGLNPTAVTFTPDGSKALVAQSGDNDCVMIDVATRTVSGPIPLGTRPTAIAR